MEWGRLKEWVQLLLLIFHLLGRIGHLSQDSRRLILIYFQAFLPKVSTSPAAADRPRGMIFGPRLKHRATVFTSRCILPAFQSVCLPYGQWPAKMGSWRVKILQTTFLHS